MIDVHRLNRRLLHWSVVAPSRIVFQDGTAVSWERVI